MGLLQHINKRQIYEKLTLSSYLGVCIDVGQINRAFNLLIKQSCPKQNPTVDVNHYNIVLKGWAKLSSVPQIVETRMHMIRNHVEPNAESFAHILLGYSKGGSAAQKKNAKKLVHEMKSRDIDPKKLFQSTYLSTSERRSIKNLLQTIDSKYDDTFLTVSSDYNCTLMKPIERVPPVVFDFTGLKNLSELENWAEHQRSVEWKSSITIKSVAKITDPPATQERFHKTWLKFHEIWRKAISKSIDDSLESLQAQSALSDKVHLYPYLCSVDKNMLLHLMLDEIETNSAFSSYSMSTNALHLQFGAKVMTRYMRAKAISDGSFHEKQRIYNQYLNEYCKNPQLMGEMNPREYIQKKAAETKNYAIYKERISPLEEWPHHVVAAVGRFLYGIILREVKFDPEILRHPTREVKPKDLVHAFYTAYFQIDGTHKIKEEFRAHKEFEKFYLKSCGKRLKFDYSYLPTSSPPLPWLSRGFGGYLTNKSELVRVNNPFAEQVFMINQTGDDQKLYPSIDSLNVISLCPWIVNKRILDIVIELFRSGGDADLTVPLDETKMELNAPKLDANASKADRILYNKEKKKYDQKKREMYSLWRDCLYRLSIANHFREKVFWFPHNMDFRGRTYPIPPHFNHLGSDLARSLLLFAKGQRLGEKGLDWLKIHLINLVGKMKSSSISERLDYANSILETDIRDSAQQPWNGRKWWQDNENPWQVLACCIEINEALKCHDPYDYVCHFPVHQDGSCNGLQHYAALGRDPGGAMAVNLVPSDRPQDVYSRVVDIVEDMRKRDVVEGNKVAKSLEGFIQRKVIKQTVMTTVYGVTRYGARQQIARQLAAKGFPENAVWQAAQYLTSRTFESIGQMFNKSRLIQDWLNECAYVIASKYRKPVSWETPLGFPVVQPYTHSSNARLSGLMSSSSSITTPIYNHPFANLHTSKQRTAFPPNYIHSLDSSHMMLTSLYCHKAGITFVSVHDCYWTHPNTVDIMNQICRQQFVALHSEPLLQQLSLQFMQNYHHQPDASSLSDEAAAAELSRQQALAAAEAANPSRSSPSSSALAPLSPPPTATMKEKMKRSLNKGGTSIASALEASQRAASQKSQATFEEVPKRGDLDLKLVLKSTYFFS